MSDYRFKTGTMLIISGPSQSGKTVGVCKILRNLNEYFIEEPDEVFWFYAHYQEDTMGAFADKITFVDGFDIDRLKGAGTKLAVIDDLMDRMSAETLAALFTRGGHHWKCSLIYICQNLYNKNQRIARINTNLVQLYKSPQDSLQVKTLGQHLFPNKPGFLVSAYELACAEPYSSLIIDLRQEIPDQWRLRDDIRIKEGVICYLPAPR
jgi:hypothetical protein